MCIVVIGGHERMKKQYQEVGKNFGYKVKVFTYDTPKLDKCIGCPDYVIMFTDVVSHKLVNVASKVCKKNNLPSIKLHNSSLNSIKMTFTKLALAGSL
ncbi:MAG: hypothetical protein VR72_09725 [Clostridiaceae bacterium BRH_c20a]|nr:MAG: hypothetical protein VR72_09725 [Clostridiaceae bacterium BRH_c20a]